MLELFALMMYDSLCGLVAVMTCITWWGCVTSNLLDLAAIAKGGESRSRTDLHFSIRLFWSGHIWGPERWIMQRFCCSRASNCFCSRKSQRRRPHTYELRHTRISSVYSTWQKGNSRRCIVLPSVYIGVEAGPHCMGIIILKQWWARKW